MKTKKIAILGAGNLGLSIAQGLIKAGITDHNNLLLTEKQASRIQTIKDLTFNVIDDNAEAVKTAELIIIAVKPKHIFSLIEEISKLLDSKKQVLVSCVTGIKANDIYSALGKTLPLYRIMPNTGISIQESMTCISSFNASKEQDKEIELIFSKLGEVIFIQEDLMAAATVMAGCGIAFALRFIRAAMQGGIEIGFSS